MDDRTRTLAAVTVIIGVLVLVAIIVGVVVSGKTVISPVPDDDAIKIIFVSPSQVPTLTPTPTLAPSTKPAKKT